LACSPPPEGGGKQHLKPAEAGWESDKDFEKYTKALKHDLGEFINSNFKDFRPIRRSHPSMNGQ
jgi:hypothetical protein